MFVGFVHTVVFRVHHSALLAIAGSMNAKPSKRSADTTPSKQADPPKKHRSSDATRTQQQQQKRRANGKSKKQRTAS